jgi:hypothetical protein
MSATTIHCVGYRKGKLHLYRRAVGTFDRTVDKIPIDKVTQPCIEARERFRQGRRIASCIADCSEPSNAAD